MNGNNRAQARGGWVTAAAGFGYWFFALVYWEALLQVCVFDSVTGKFAYVAGFSAALACVLALLLSFVPRKARFWVELASVAVLTVLYGSQLVYYFVFGTMYSLALMQQGGAAVTSFWKETLMTMWQELPSVLLLLVPVVVLCLLRKWHSRLPERMGIVSRCVLAGAGAAFYALVILILPTGGTGMFSDHYYYHSSSIATNQNVQRFGLMTTFRLELLGSGEEEPETVTYYVPEVETEPEPAETGAVQTEEEEQPLRYNVLELDFAALNEKTEDEKILALNAYCQALTGTSQNAYTGMLADYNLILLCAESFSTAAIHPEVTPTLYKLANEGIIFQNYYNTFPNTTTDGEYALLQGLYPDSSREKQASSQYASRNSYLPFTLGNIFAEQKAVQSFGYHNYKGDYYGRNESHPNMGYTMKFAKDGMTFSSSWPASDLEMMEQSVDDYIGQEQFHAYYMTFSGHYMYNVKTNVMAERNWDSVSHLEYSNTCLAYLSCNVELDKAMEYLLQRLEEAGIADKTAIVLVGDHYPYGLTDAEYSELIGYEIDEFSKYKSSLIFWVGGLEENIVVEEYCCNVDVLPTILNLWGFEYDSRMLAGTDVFSDGIHVATLVDKSFLTDKVWFSANTGKIRYLVPEEELPEGYVENMIRLVSTRFSISSDILNTAYYNFVFHKGDVSVNRWGWSAK